MFNSHMTAFTRPAQLQSVAVKHLSNVNEAPSQFVEGMLTDHKHLLYHNFNIITIAYLCNVLTALKQVCEAGEQGST